MEFNVFLNETSHVPETMVIFCPELDLVVVLFLIEGVQQELGMQEMGELIVSAHFQEKGRFEIL